LALKSEDNGVKKYKINEAMIIKLRIFIVTLSLLTLGAGVSSSDSKNLKSIEEGSKAVSWICSINDRLFEGSYQVFYLLNFTVSNLSSLSSGLLSFEAGINGLLKSEPNFDS